MQQGDAHTRVRELFDAACELDTAARSAYLDDACGGDVELRAEVESLLASYDRTPTAALFPPLLRADEDMAPAVGERLGPYTLGEEIGAGGMGVVHRATRDDVGKTVAIKLVRHGRLASPEQLRRFRLEQRVLARLEHPNIAQLLDAGVTASGLPYLVMEYVDGDPIDRYCDAHRLTLDDRLALFARVCDAVHYAHRHLVVHRDLKPSNIAVARDGMVKLLDFGIAALLDDGAVHDGDGAARGSAERITRTGFLMLTPEYAAPEQVRGEPVTTASDVYALGLLLYEMLSGVQPFRRAGRTTPELLRAICEEQPVPPSVAMQRAPGDAASARLARRLAGDLDTIVLTALRKEPERRYHSAQELRDDIDRHLRGLPVRARGDALWYRTRKFLRRHRAAVAAAALAVVTLSAGVVATATQARRADAARAVAEQRFRDVRALAGALVSDVHDAISDMPGALPARATLITRAIEHLDRLERQSDGDPVLRQEIAEAYVKLGLAQGNPTDANLGDLAAARRSFARALDIAAALVKEDPGNQTARRTLALAHEKMSDADAWGGKLPDGIAHARSALEQWERLAQASPASASAGSAVAMSHIKLGDLLGNPNLPNVADRAGAIAEYRHALGRMNALSRDSLQEWPARRLLALVHERLGSMLSMESGNADGIAELEQTLAIREGLARERATSVNALRDLAVTHQILCEAQHAAGNGDEALLHCRRAIALYDSLRATDPQNAQSLHDLALGRQSMHKVLAARGELHASLAELERSAALLRSIVAAHADNSVARRNLARSLLFATSVHATLATTGGGESEARHAHRERAARTYEDGRKLLIQAFAPAQPSGEDGALLEQARLALAKIPRER
ncbi:MAG TPA: serine/threonine-protein kinase [Gemmatimonadaceae bacterium]|nr:serine/threonine-protein kinase [Gemmatimonadaceae bacterium]